MIRLILNLLALYSLTHILAGYIRLRWLPSHINYLSKPLRQAVLTTGYSLMALTTADYLGINMLPWYAIPWVILAMWIASYDILANLACGLSCAVQSHLQVNDRVTFQGQTGTVTGLFSTHWQLSNERNETTLVPYRLLLTCAWMRHDTTESK